MDKFLEKYNIPKLNQEEILKIRAEINAKETKETIAKINTAKSWLLR